MGENKRSRSKKKRITRNKRYTTRKRSTSRKRSNSRNKTRSKKKIIKRSKKRTIRVSKGGNITQNGGINLTNILKNPVLNAYLKLNMITNADPSTLIPIGILIVLYEEFFKEDIQKGGSFLKSNNIRNLSIQNKLPKSLNISTKLPLSTLLPNQSTQTGGKINILNDPLLQKYLNLIQISKLTPGQLLPLGLLMYLYNKYGELNQNLSIRKIQPNKGKTSIIGGKQNDIDVPILNNPVLDQYKKNKNIKELKCTTLLPLALIMSLNIFKKHI